MIDVASKEITLDAKMDEPSKPTYWDEEFAELFEIVVRATVDNRLNAVTMLRDADGLNLWPVAGEGLFALVRAENTRRRNLGINAAEFEMTLICPVFIKAWSCIGDRGATAYYHSGFVNGGSNCWVAQFDLADIIPVKQLDELEQRVEEELRQYNEGDPDEQTSADLADAEWHNANRGSW